MFEIPRKLQRQCEINELVEYHGIIHVERALEVHRTTIGRWCKGQIPVPISAIIALRALKGEYPFMEAKQWKGWGFGRDGKLYSDANQGYETGDIRAIPYQIAQIQALEAQVKDLTKQLEAAGVNVHIQIPANERWENPLHPDKLKHDELENLRSEVKRRKRRW